jgi:pyruvate/2-oxoglutarate dehydrogenase complex dihydrolipoamide acyltransferase (E2) component
MTTYKMSTRKKLAIATWSTPTEGNIFGKLSLDLTRALQYINFVRETKGEKISITHIVGNAAGKALKVSPDVNGRIFLGRYIPHESADVAFLVSLEGGTDLAKVKVSNIDTKSNIDIAKELRVRAEQLRAGKDSEFEKSKPIIRMLPTWLIRPILWLTGYVTGAMGFDIKALGLEKFPFGSCVVTSVGMFGIDEGYAPQTPFARVPVYIAVTRIKDRVAAHNGRVIIRPEIDLMATIDHRFMDGHQGALLAKKIRELVESPWLLDGYSEMPFKDKFETPLYDAVIPAQVQ